MEALFLQILQMSMSASWLIIAVILIRFLLQKAPKGFRYVLWALVAVRLLCPVFFESELSLIPNMGVLSEVGDAVKPVTPINPDNDAEINDTILNDGAQDDDVRNDVVQSDNVQNNNATQNGENQNNIIQNNAIQNNTTQDDIPQNTVTTQTDLISVMTFIWVGGVLALFAYVAVSYVQLRITIKESIKKEDNLWICDGIQTPFILGLMKPQIYLPSYIEENHIPYILAHENEHIRLKDHWWKILGFALLTVHWFNPFVWVAYILMCRDIELACDERVIRSMSVEDKKNYSKSLLFCSNPGHFISACPVAFGEVGVKERIKKIVDYRKSSTWIITIAAILCLIVAFGFMTNPKQNAKDVAMIALGCGDGRLVWANITDADEIQKIIDGVNELSFVPISPNLPTGGWSYVIRMYDADGEVIDRLTVLDDRRVEKEYFVYYSLSGKFDTEYYDELLAKAEFERLENLQSGLSSLQGMTELQKDTLEWFNTKYFNNDENRITNAFLTSTYQDAKNIDLNYLFYAGVDGVGGDTVSEEEKQLLAQKDSYAQESVYDLDVSKTAKHDMEAVLEKYLGMSLEETNKVNLNKLYYLESYDAYYKIAGDTVTSKYYFTKGWKEDETGNIILHYFDALNGNPEDLYMLTLKLVNGNYQFVSNVSMTGNNKVEDSQGEEENAINLISEDLMQHIVGEYFKSYTFQCIASHFLTDVYTTPEDINLYELFYNGSYIVGTNSMVSEEEKQLLLNRFLDEIHGNVVRIKTWEMNEVLQKYMGITLEETNKYGLDKMYYLEEYDAYYMMHSDTNWFFANFEAGKINEDGTITLQYYRDNYYDGTTPTYWVTLKEVEGKYYIISNIRVASE